MFPAREAEYDSVDRLCPLVPVPFFPCFGVVSNMWSEVGASAAAAGAVAGAVVSGEVGTLPTDGSASREVPGEDCGALSSAENNDGGGVGTSAAAGTAAGNEVIRAAIAAVRNKPIFCCVGTRALSGRTVDRGVRIPGTFGHYGNPRRADSPEAQTCGKLAVILRLQLILQRVQRFTWLYPHVPTYDLLRSCTLPRLYPVALPPPGAAVVLGNTWTRWELSRTKSAS